MTDFKIDFSDNDLQIDIQKIIDSKYHFPKNYYQIKIIEYSEYYLANEFSILISKQHLSKLKEKLKNI